MLDFINKIKTTKKKDPYSDGDFCLQMIIDNWDVQNENRYEVLKTILQESKKYSDALHFLACAYACHYSKAEYRKQAIEYFENYLVNPVQSGIPFFCLSQIYSDLGKDYEGEYEFSKAEISYLLSIQNKTGRRYSSITGQYDIYPEEVMLGRLYLKIDTQKAVDYWKSLMNYDIYINGSPNESGFRRHVDFEYNSALEKHQKGYTYKPRKK